LRLKGPHFYIRLLTVAVDERRVNHDPTLQPLVEVAMADNHYALVVWALLHSWYRNKLTIDHPGRALISVWDRLSLQDPLILLNVYCIIVPEAQR